jgi:hypothetical protein
MTQTKTDRSASTPRIRERPAPKSYFKPLDPEEHAKGNAGYDVEDLCQHCNRPFLTHTNAACPSD